MYICTSMKIEIYRKQNSNENNNLGNNVVMLLKETVRKFTLDTIAF